MFQQVWKLVSDELRFSAVTDIKCEAAKYKRHIKNPQRSQTLMTFITIKKQLKESIRIIIVIYKYKQQSFRSITSYRLTIRPQTSAHRAQSSEVQR